MTKEKHRTGKWKYGSVSALMLAMVLIALIALNAGIYALEKKKGWRIDLSFNGITSQSAETAEILREAIRNRHWTSERLLPRVRNWFRTAGWDSATIPIIMPLSSLRARISV